MRGFFFARQKSLNKPDLNNNFYFCRFSKALKKLLFIVLGSLLVFAACKKDHRVLGTDVQPGTDGLNTSYDSLASIQTFTKKFDAVISYNTKYKFLGCNQDPYFGNTSVGLYLNANMSVSNLTLGTNPVLQSAEIVLAVDALDYIGDKTAALNFSVYALDSTLSTSRVYSTSISSLEQPTKLNSASLTFTVVNGVTALRIPVDSTYASSIATQPQYLVDNTTFQSRYKGFYIKCANQSGSEGIIYKCNLEDGISGFYLHYKPTPSDTLRSFQFTFSGSAARRINQVVWDSNNAPNAIYQQINGGDTVSPSKLYLKGLGNTKIRVKIPAIKNYADSFKVAVNRAELIFNVANTQVSSNSKYTPPPYLTLLPIDSTGKEQFATDQLNGTDAARYNGYYDSINKQYVFNIARHVQAIMSGKTKNYGFNLLVTDPNPVYTAFRDLYAARVVLEGGPSATYKPKFRINYVKFPKD